MEIFIGFILPVLLPMFMVILPFILVHSMCNDMDNWNSDYMNLLYGLILDDEGLISKDDLDKLKYKYNSW